MSMDLFYEHECSEELNDGQRNYLIMLLGYADEHRNEGPFVLAAEGFVSLDLRYHDIIRRKLQKVFVVPERCKR